MQHDTSITSTPDIGRRNVEAYRLLFEIENGLREMIISSMARKYGPKWLKQNVPGDVRGHMKDGKEYEKKIVWMNLAPHHPIYYTDFPDLRKIIVQSENWKSVFSERFGQKLHIESELSDLEPIRNKIAHGRVITEGDLSRLRAFHEIVEKATGRPIAEMLCDSLRSYCAIPDHLRRLRELLVKLKLSFEDASDFTSLSELRDLATQWWFDETYLLRDTTEMSEVAKLAEDYNRLPKGRGTAYQTERWLRDAQAAAKLDAAIHIVEELLEDVRGKI